MLTNKGNNKLTLYSSDLQTHYQQKRVSLVISLPFNGLNFDIKNSSFSTTVYSNILISDNTKKQNKLGARLYSDIKINFVLKII